MTTPGECPYCHEPIRPGARPAGCPFLDQASCPWAQGVAGSLLGSDPEETITYRGGTLSKRDSDGFPEEDDLSDRMLGQYCIGPVIGWGSMGRVYRAEHVTLGRLCAVKVMNPGLIDRQPRIIEHFWAEARAIARLVHPHIVTVHNLGSDRGYHYIEMEYVPEGVSLKETLVRAGALEPLRATDLTHQVVLALAAAHHSGLVHRDVKPSNVLLTASGQAKLADFGLARHLSELETTGANVAGTPTFMAPELFAGRPASPHSDLYAVGVMYYYLLTARLPFAADRIGRLIRLHRSATIPDVREVSPHVPDEVQEILSRCLAKRPTERYESADALTEDLRTLLFHLRDTESLIRESLEGLEGSVAGGPARYRIELRVPGGRLQEVYVETHDEGPLSERRMSVYSVCGPADPTHYEFALKLNAKLTYGGLSIHHVNDQPMFVMSRTYSQAHVNASEVRAAIQEIARRSDWVEQRLTQTDVY